MAEQELVSRDDILAAQRLIRAEAAAGRLSADQAARRSEAVIHCVTPHDLYTASGGLAGSRQISKEAKAERWKAVRLAVAIVVFAMVVMLLVVWAFMREADRPGGASGGATPRPVLPSVVV
jgi:hypothetical protein